ncbi:MAG: hypothetical protein PHQ46_10685, partial [Negativicutes bacterium]|nr:hypothetical protein [Negativicutes bacterium]
MEYKKGMIPSFGGVIIEDRETDWKIGGASSIPYEIVMPSGDWIKWYSIYERQKKKTETMSCVTFSAHNGNEAQMNFMSNTGVMTSEAIKFFIENGYLVNGQFNFSDRFTAIMSGTTPEGNSCQNVWDSIRKDGLLPEADCPFTDSMTSAQYFKNDISQAQKDKAKRVLDYINVAYEWVIQNSVTALAQWEKDEIAKALKQAPLQLITPVCKWDKTPAPCGNINCQHATSESSISQAGYPIVDTYDPFEKVLSPDYVIRYAQKGVVILNDKYKSKTMIVDEAKLEQIYQELLLGSASDDPEAKK